MGLGVGLELGVGVGLEFGFGLPPVKKPGRLTTRRAGCCGGGVARGGLPLPVTAARGGEVLLLDGAAVGSTRPARRVGSVEAALRRSSKWGIRRGGVSATTSAAVASASSQRKPMESAGSCGSERELE